MKANLQNVPEELRDRTWYIENDAYAFLVDAPITLGHSQLRVSVTQTQQEEDAFNSAARHISKCIRVLRTTLFSLQLDKWTSLACYTGTSGDFKKTLILKVSANEGKNEYKIHLVPFFSSHLSATNKLYAATQEIDSGEPGGLLYWVGQRERIVDYDMRYGRKDETVRKRIDSFRLPELADHLYSKE